MSQGTNSTVVEDKTYLAQDSLGPLMLRLGFLTIAAQLINLLYSIVDRIFIGHMGGAGTASLTAIGVCMPLITVISAFALFAGNGGSPLASMALGRKDQRDALQVVGNATTLLLIFAAVILVILEVFAVPLLSVFGCSQETLPYGVLYLRIYALGTFFVMGYLGLSPFLLAQGNSKHMLLAVGVGALMNVVLDALFILVLGWGVAGAALGSIVSQGISGALVVFLLCHKKSALPIKWEFLRLKAKVVKEILWLGVGPFFITATEAILFIVLNSTLQRYGGDLYVASLTIMQSEVLIFFALIQGFAHGTAPILSYCYGARCYSRVKKGFFIMLTVCLVFSAAGGLIATLTPRTLSTIFTSDEAVLLVVDQTSRVFFLGLIIFGAQSAMQATFGALGKGRHQLVVACVRKLVLFVPLTLLLPKWLGVWGVFLAEPISDTISVVFCSILFFCTIRPLLRESAKGEEEEFAA